VHQYFGIKAAQQHVCDHKGGIIWHTQGSGKSIIMVLLAKWILENNPNARVAIVTDRDELDKQIERVFTEVGEPIKRTNSGYDLMRQLGQATPRLVCSLVHKFVRRHIEDFEAFIKELESQPSKTVGEVFVFVDECFKGNKNAVAETIENNVRSKIIKEHLNDPAYFEKMSVLLDEIIAARKAKAVEYEEYLKRIAELAKRVEAGQASETPETLDTRGKRALFNNLNQNEELALRIDETIKKTRPDDWRGVQPKERVIKAALYGVLQDAAEVERIFLIIKAHKEY
jgi:type I site-specific restriction-modification system R (restriction) subunit